MRRIRITSVLFVVSVFHVGQATAVDTTDDPSPPVAGAAMIPQPVHFERAEGEFRFAASTVVVASGGARAEATRLVDALAPAMGFQLRLVNDAAASERQVALTLDVALRDQLGEEGYTLMVTPQRVELRAAATAGLFYGIQTVRQMLPPQIFSPNPIGDVAWSIPSAKITDYPRFRWRGLLIDPARHFIPLADVKHFIDTMAAHKFNRLQMHLTDNEGWRIEIKKYPKLTQIGSQMDWNLLRTDGTGPRCFGFYSQDEIRELVRYAAARHVTIVPEIEMPYHTGAAIVAYPTLGLGNAPLAELPPQERWRKTTGLIAPRPKTVAFLQDVLAEVIELFPSRHIHIGGDEASIALWAKDPEMQAEMKRLHLKDAHSMHSHFIRQIDTYLTKQGRQLVGWDEILQGGLAEGATVMSWRGVEGGIKAARAGHDVVMAPTSHTYFDYRQAPHENGLGRSVIDLQKVHSFEPIPAELTPQQATHILGGQGQLWGELIATAPHRDFMAWPRACALAEVLWSPKESRNLELFSSRLGHHLKRLAAADVNFRPVGTTRLSQNPKEPNPSPEDGQAGHATHSQAMASKGRIHTDATRAAGALLARLLPDHVEHFAFENIVPDAGRDVFEIESRGGRTVIRGNTAVSMSMGLNWYLKHHCRCHVSWCGDQLALPNPLPAVELKVRRVAWAKHRYFLNYCCFGYSLPWWDWPQWERLIDWMALNGINTPLAVTGQEAVWRAIGERLGLREDQMRAFLAGPPYLPFGWMGCLDGWGGPLPSSWIERHEALGKKILARERQLGMTPVLQGFTGHVPAAIGEKFPDAKLHTIHWIEWETFLLDPLDPLFAKISKLFMEEQTIRFGTDHLYASDSFIEMTPPAGDLKYLENLSQAIHNGLAASDPQSVWVLQTWIFLNQQAFWTQDRIQAFLGAVPHERMLCLDLWCEDRPQWSRTEAFYGKPWIWCNVQNFGCTVHLGGALDVNNDGLTAARRSSDRGTLAGLGFVNEGLGYNPVAYDLMFEMAWRDDRVDLNRWISDYAHHRYGQSNADAARAWQILAETVYTAPHRTRSIIDQVPSLSPAHDAPYDNRKLADAWRLLLQAADQLGTADTYRFDVVNTARQALSNHAATLQRRVVDAHRSGDAEAFRTEADRFLQQMRDLDALLATRPEFLLGRCLEDAKRWGTTDAERAKCEWNARRVLTLWGTGKAIRDYARKEWAGMISGFYLKRWEWFLREEATALATQQPADKADFHRRLLEWEENWAERRDSYPTEPHGDSVEIARELWAKYGESLAP